MNRIFPLINLIQVYSTTLVSFLVTVTFTIFAVAGMHASSWTSVRPILTASGELSNDVDCWDAGEAPPLCGRPESTSDESHVSGLEGLPEPPCGGVGGEYKGGEKNHSQARGSRFLSDEELHALSEERYQEILLEPDVDIAYNTYIRMFPIHVQRTTGTSIAAQSMVTTQRTKEKKRKTAD